MTRKHKDSSELFDNIKVVIIIDNIFYDIIYFIIIDNIYYILQYYTFMGNYFKYFTQHLVYF